MADEAQALPVPLTYHDVLALKAGLDVLASEHRRKDISAPRATLDHLADLLARLQPLVEQEEPTTITLTPAEAATLAYYVEQAMRLRGYVVGRPEANEWFVRLYRKLKAVSRGTSPPGASRWGRLVGFLKSGRK